MFSMICYLIYFSKNTQLFRNRWLAKFKVVRKQDKDISLKKQTWNIETPTAFLFYFTKRIKKEVSFFFNAKTKSATITFSQTARVFGALSSLLFMLMLLLMADGFTIIKGRMKSRTSIIFSVFFTVYVISYATLYIVEANVRMR